MFDFGFHFFGNSRSSTPPPPPPSDDFIIKVKTDNAGSEANQFTLPTTGSGYDYTIDWGDGTVENITSNASQTHTYPTAGEYVITISGTFPRIIFNNGGDRLKLIEIINFGDVGWTSMENSFYGCENMDINENATGNFSGVSNYIRAWRNCSSLISFPALNLSNGIDFLQAWRDCTSMETFNATALGSGSYQSAWQNCTSLTSFPALDLSGGTNFGFAWSGCSSMVSFNTTLLGSGNIRDAWRDCSSLISFPSVTFSGAVGSNAQDAWRDCTSLETFGDVDLSGVTTLFRTWRNCGNITSFATRNFFDMTNGTNAFRDTTLPTSDYSDILITQRANNNNNNLTFDGGNSKHNTAGGIARAELTDTVANGGQNWSILDGGAE